jgi:hypothetical protein
MSSQKPSDTAFDDAARLRAARSASDAKASRPPGSASRGAPCMVAQTKTVTTYPTAAGKYFACAPVDVTGAETEGGSGTFTVATTTFYALNLGTAIPVTGTNVLVTFVDNRWTFRYDG